MKKLVITGRDVDYRAIIDLVGKTLMIAGRPYVIAGGVIPQGEVTRYECRLYQIYQTTTLLKASGIFRTHGRAVVVDNEKEGG